MQIRGDLQVDGTTTTVNSTTMTVQDPIITLGGEDTLLSDDNKDRGIEIRYYDTQERFGFFGWDEDYADSNIWSGTGGHSSSTTPPTRLKFLLALTLLSLLVTSD